MAATILELIVTGVVDIDFITDDAYHLVRWSPAVGRRATGTMLGQNVYEDVTEEMEITISGASVLAKLAEIAQLFDIAEKWARGERKTGAYMNYIPDTGGQTKTAIITGGTEIILPDNFVMSPVTRMIDPVIIRFRRRGVWLERSIDTASSSAVAHPAVASITGLTVTEADSPIAIAIGAMAEFDAWDYPWYVLRARASTDLILLAAKDLATGGVFTSVDDSTNDAKNTNVLRFTPSDTNWWSPVTPITGFSMNDNGYRWGIFINYRNNSGSTTFQVKINLCGQTTPAFQVPINAGPRWVFAGIVSLPLSVTESIFLTVKASAASGSVDFDSIAIVLLDTPLSGQVIEIIDGDGSAPGAGDFKIEHNLDVFTPPQVYRNTAANYLTYTGSPIFWLPSNDTALVMAMLATDNAKWVPCTDAGTPYSTAFTVVQDGGYLTIE